MAPRAKSPSAPARTVLVANRHPRLRLARRALVHAIHILDAGFRVLPGDRKYLTQRPAGDDDDVSPVAPGDLSLVFVTDTTLAQLHADFLGDPTPTDVITFAGNPALGSAGEVCVSADAARRQVGARARDDVFAAELLLYVVHGWLHLAGFDDLRPDRKRAMRRAESRAFRLLRTHLTRLPEFRLG